MPVVAPEVHDGRTLFELGGFRYAVYRRQGGHWPELGTPDERKWMGRFLARIHAIGRVATVPSPAAARLAGHGRRHGRLSAGAGVDSSAHRGGVLVGGGRRAGAVEQRFDEATPYRTLRLHGDCHPGNVLWTDAGPHFVDLDDCVTGPAVQDLWMLLSGRPEEMSAQLHDLLEGYGEFADFDYHERSLIEPLRTLRIMHYAGWLARRWDDPAFPRAFPWFEEPKYWEQHVLDLREQMAAMEEPPL